MQSTSDIVSVIVNFYLNKEYTFGLEERQNTAESATDKELIKKIVKVSTVILKKKFVPLVENDFKQYKKDNLIFLEMMRKKNIQISNEESLCYMNYTLTFFSRLKMDVENIYFIFAVILTRPNYIVFLLLVYFYHNLDSDIYDVTRTDVLNQLEELEEQFNQINNKKNKYPF